MADTLSADEKVGAPGSVTTSTGAGAVDDVHYQPDWTLAEERAIRTKFDLTITPMVTILCTCASGGLRGLRPNRWQYNANRTDMCCAIDRANVG
jgi:hypothetical protein